MPDDPDMLVVLTSARTEFEAQTLAEAIRARGIRAEVFATAASSLQWEAGYTDPIKVMVRRADVEEAEKVRAGLKADSVDIDWDEVETGGDGGDGGTVGAVGAMDAERPRRGSRLGAVSRIGWSLMAVALALFLGNLVAGAAWAAGFRGGAPGLGLAVIVGTLVVLWMVMRKR